MVYPVFNNCCTFCLSWTQASWTGSKPKLEKDPQRRAANPDLGSSDMEKLFREHIKMLHEVNMTLLFLCMKMNLK